MNNSKLKLTKITLLTNLIKFNKIVGVFFSLLNYNYLIDQ